MPTAAEIVTAVDRANKNIETLENLNASDRTFDEYHPAALKIYLEELVEQLKELFPEQAVIAINLIIGNGDLDFDFFDGLDTSENLFTYDPMRLIYDAVVNCVDEEDDVTELACLVQATSARPEIDAAVKERIIIEVNNKVAFTYTGRDVGGTAFPVVVNGQEYPWDAVEVSASALFEGIPFVYNRQDAADKAIEMAEKGQNQALSDYNFIQYGTDSARFMSIAIHAGGLPFTTTDDTGVNICDDLVALGWCAFF